MEDSSLLILIGALVLLALGIIFIGSITQSKWGVNLSPVRCPSCQTVQPKVRVPTDAYEVKWGGATCTNCGTKMDKWGRFRS